MVAGGRGLVFGTPAWNALYAQRVGSFMNEATRAGSRVLWVGMPPMQDGGLSAQMRVLDALAQQQAVLHKGVTFMSSWNVLGGRSGTYQPYMTVQGSLQQVRRRRRDPPDRGRGRAVDGGRDRDHGQRLQAAPAPVTRP